MLIFRYCDSTIFMFSSTIDSTLHVCHSISIKIMGSLCCIRKRKLENTLRETNLTPARAVRQVDSTNGGYMLASSSSDLCRNPKQAWNINQKVNSSRSSFASSQFGKKDDLSEVMKQCKSERKGEEFVHEVVSAPEPRCVLANKRQISDLVSFCCGERPHNCVLGVDQHFTLANFM